VVDSVIKLSHRDLYGSPKSVEFGHFLHQDCCQRGQKTLLKLEDFFFAVFLEELFWKLILKLLDALEDHLLWCGTTTTASDSRLDAQHSHDHVVGLLLLIADVSVGVETEHIWHVDERQGLDVVLVRLGVAMCRRVVDAIIVVFVFVVEVIVAVVLEQGLEEAPSIPVVCDATTVVNLASHVVEGLVRNVLLVFQEHLEHLVGSLKIRVVELVGIVKAERAKLATLLRHSVEETQTKDKFAPDLWLFAVVEVRVRNVLIRSLHVGLDSSWWLGGELDRILKDTDREVVGGHRGKEKTERLKVLFLLLGPIAIVSQSLEFKHNLFKIRHEGLAQMAILQKYPMAVLCCS